MNVKSYRAKSLPEALQLVQRDLGPHAAVLQTRQVWDGLLRGLLGCRCVEVTASADVQLAAAVPAPHAMPINAPQDDLDVDPPNAASSEHASPPFNPLANARETPSPFQQAINPSQIPPSLGCPSPQELDQIIDRLCHQSSSMEMPPALFRVYTDLVEAEIDEEIARDLTARLRSKATLGELDDGGEINQRLHDLVCGWIRPHGPIQVTEQRQRIAALVGPTGVGKTTTIAKLAANYRLRERQRVGLITVDTYRIAAVEQLRTYAEIIDLPMEVVGTQREMREAIERLSDMDLILMDTAGRSPRDEVRIQELKMLLQEANVDEVHLVLSSTSSAKALVSTARKFADVGTTALLITKMDEATGLGELLPLLQNCDLPLSYLTNGQSVPDDIQVAEPTRLANGILTGAFA